MSTKLANGKLRIEDVVAAAEAGKLQEAFGTGTAAVISPVGTLHCKGQNYRVADGKTGVLSQRLYDYMLALQYGKERDPFGWVERIDL